MAFLAALWLPILLSAIIVFISSSIMHAVLKYHQSDCHKFTNEEKVLEMLRGEKLERGLYIFPFSAPKGMKSSAMLEKYKLGPVGMMTVMPSGPPFMPRFLGQWFVFCLVVSIFVAYLAWHTVSAGANYLAVFRVVGTAAFLAYGLGHLSEGIWKGQTWSMTIKEVIDGLVYGLLTAGTFGWLWPR
ncbi:MAG: hypothetical protein WAK48_14340 [Candidatus Acidiferrum sp.]|jgi:hypothetical protein